MELAAGGAHRVDPAALCSVLQRLGYTAKLHESTASLFSFKQGVRHSYISVCLPGALGRGQEERHARARSRAHLWALANALHCARSVAAPCPPPPCQRLHPGPTPLPFRSADSSAAGLATYIVEPNFRDCFCIAHPTPRFAALLDGVPPVAVASKVGALVVGWLVGW